MKDNSEKWKSLRRLLFLLPAVLVAALIAYTLPNTQPVLAAVPELLEYEPTPTPEPTPKPDREAQRAEAEAKHADPTAGRKATVASFTAPSAYRDGSYTGSAQGFGGMITVSVTIRDGRIAAVQVTSAPGETEPYFSKAKTVTGRIVVKRRASGALSESVLQSLQRRSRILPCSPAAERMPLIFSRQSLSFRRF